MQIKKAVNLGKDFQIQNLGFFTAPFFSKKMLIYTIKIAIKMTFWDIRFKD